MGNVWGITSQIIGYFNITLTVSQYITIDNSLQQVFFTQRTFITNFFSELNFDWCVSFLETPPFTLPHLNGLSYVTSTHLILFPSLYSPNNICITQRKLCFLTGTIVVLTYRSFKNSVTRIANSINIETINFLLSTSANITLNFTVRSKSLKIW